MEGVKGGEGGSVVSGQGSPNYIRQHHHLYINLGSGGATAGEMLKRVFCRKVRCCGVLSFSLTPFMYHLGRGAREGRLNTTSVLQQRFKK